MYAAWINHDTSPETESDIGFHHDLFDVELAVFGVEQWHIPPFPGGLFDQPESLLMDMIRYIGARARVREESAGLVTAPPDAYEDYEDTESFSL